MHNRSAHLLFVSFCCVLVAAGCQQKYDEPRGAPQTSRNMDRPEQTIIIENEADALGSFIKDVQNARNAQAEGEALRRLWRHLSDRGLTYAIRSHRVDDKAAVEDASVVREPVRTEVTIFRGRDTVRTFQFVPRDNRNLVILGD